MRLAALVVAVARIRWHTGCSFISRNGRHALHRLQHIHGTNGLHHYVMGVTDALSLMGAICTPEHFTARQAIDVVVKYLRAHPEQRPLSAAMQVRGALQEAFPCKEQAH